MLASPDAKSSIGESVLPSSPTPNAVPPPVAVATEEKYAALSLNGQNFSDLVANVRQNELANLLSKISQHCFDEKESHSSKLSVLAGSLAGWISASHMNHEIGDRIHDELEHWLHANFCFGRKLVAHFHSAPAEAISIVLRSMALTEGKKMTDTWTVYVTPALLEEDPSYALALKEWPCFSVLDLPQKIDGAVDAEALTALIEKDKSEGKVPALIVASVGSGLAGICDNINSLVPLCRKHNIWLHLEGARLARRIIRSLDESSPKILMQLPDVRSMTLDLGTWLGYLGAPVLTIVRPPFQAIKSADPSEQSALETSFDQTVSLANNSWPTFSGAAYYWLMLQHLGCKEISLRLKLRLDLAQKMAEELLNIDGVMVLNREKPVKQPDGPAERVYRGREILGALAEVLEKEANKPEPPVPIAVMFRYSGKQDGDEASQSVIPAVRLDVLNHWLAESAGRSAPGLFIGAVTFRGSSWIRFAPFDVPLKGSEESLKKEMDNFLIAVKRQVAALEATNDQRPRLAAALQSSQYVNCLQLVALPNWAGLGAVRYCPPDDQSSKPWTPEKVDSLNIEIVRRLRQTDTAFSLGKALRPLVMKPELNESLDGKEDLTIPTLACIRFGLVTVETDVEHLCSTVCRAGSEIQEELQQLEQMASVVRRGIEEANREIEHEQAVRVYEEGVLRHIPIVGNLLNWWSPPSPAKPISGRRLNLSSGRVSPTSGNLNQPSPPASPAASLDTHQEMTESLEPRKQDILIKPETDIATDASHGA